MKTFDDGRIFCVTLSTGAVVNMNANTTQEAFKVVDNLLDKIVLEHSEEIIKSQRKNGKSRASQIIDAEVRHLAEDPLFADPKHTLCWFLKVLALERLIHITHPYLITGS